VKCLRTDNRSMKVFNPNRSVFRCNNQNQYLPSTSLIWLRQTEFTPRLVKNSSVEDGKFTKLTILR
jgi:hypothetical protein